MVGGLAAGSSPASSQQVSETPETAAVTTAAWAAGVAYVPVAGADQLVPVIAGVVAAASLEDAEEERGYCLACC
jgi:hypothetical protein